MRLNTLKPQVGAKRKAVRVGRGIGSGKGKTCGRGHKGQTSRSGSSIPIGFEGGQMKMAMRLPKFGFTSRVSLVTAEIRLHELNQVEGDLVTLETLHAVNLIPTTTKRARIFLSGELKKAVTVKGIKVTKGAREAIVNAGGKVEE